MEVHAPEHALHTRREFLVHMLAITLGLLIAVGIDQGVEYLHHQHLRHELEENMLAEAQRNIDILNRHLEVNVPNMLWYRAALKAVLAAKPDGGYVDITLPPPDPNASTKPMVAPERTTYPVAQATGAIALLPEAEAQTYSVMDFQAAEDAKEVDAIRAAAALVDRFELAAGTKVSPGAHLRLTLAQRDQLITALSVYAQELYDLLRRDDLFLIVCQGIASGITDVDTLMKYAPTHPPVAITRYRE